MKLNKLIAGAAAIAMLGSLATAVPAMAEGQETMIITVSDDYQFHGTDSSTTEKGSNTGSIEVRRDGTGDYLGVLKFDLTELKALKETGATIDSVELQLVTERSKSGNTTLDIKSIDVDLNSDTTYSDITFAMATGVGAGSITLARGVENKAIFDGTKDEDPQYGDLQLWTSITDITEAVDTEEDNNIILTLRNNSDSIQQQKFISSKLATDYESGNKTRRSTALYNFGIIDTTEVLTDEQYAALDVSSVVPQLIVTYTPYDTTGKAARIGSVYYDTLDSAINAATSDDTIVLVNDASIDEPLYVNKDGNKNINLSGNNHTVTLNGTLEFKNSNKFNVSDVTFAGDSGVDMKNSTVIMANNVKFNNITLGGSSGSKGTLTNCAVTNMTTYGKITLVGTAVTNAKYTIGKSDTNDKPYLILDENSSVENLNVDSIDSSSAPYTLFEGNGTVTNVTVPDGYVYSDGVISEKAAETPASASYTLIQDWTDADDPASAWELTVKAGTYAVDSFELSISDGDKNYSANEKPSTTSISVGSTVVFGVAVNKASSFVQGMTLNVTSGSADSSIDAALAE